MEGAKFPDEAVMRFFFKEGLHKTPGRVVEFGCGAGNNLALLFLQYGYEVVGVDCSESALCMARYNCGLAVQGDSDEFKTAEFYGAALGGYVPWEHIGKFDVLLFPGIIYYLSREDLLRVLARAAASVAKPGAWIFVRARGMSDYRLGRGKRVEKNGTVLTTEETGEDGCRNVCYHEYELVDMFRDAFGLDPETMRVMHIHFENRMMCRVPEGDQMMNHDIVLYGRAK